MDIVPITSELLTTATFLAKQRLLYEYPRIDYGTYQHNKHLENLTNGYLGELAFLRLITTEIKDKYKTFFDQLKNNYAHDIAENLYNNIKNENFSWNAIIGQTDEGYDFKKDNFIIDIKTYGTSYLIKRNNSYILENNQRDINSLNLLIDQRQGSKYINNNNNIIFIQTFIEKNNNNLLNVIFAGYHRGLPPLNTKFPNPAYACKVSDLQEMHSLYQLLNLN